MDRCWSADSSARSRGRVVIEPGLGQALAALREPIAHLDFETINPAIPVWAGCRPYDQVPVQFSVDLEPWGRRVRPIHHEWLAEGPGDPRPRLALHGHTRHRRRWPGSG